MHKIIKFIVHPGFVTVNGKQYFLSVQQLIKRYRVDPELCISDSFAADLPSDIFERCTHLYPRENDEDYTLYVEK